VWEYDRHLSEENPPKFPINRSIGTYSLAQTISGEKPACTFKFGVMNMREFGGRSMRCWARNGNKSHLGEHVWTTAGFPMEFVKISNNRPNIEVSEFAEGLFCDCDSEVKW
jgi:hypothetical protein